MYEAESFAPLGLLLFSEYQRLAPWAAFLRRFAAFLVSASLSVELQRIRRSVHSSEFSTSQPTCECRRAAD